MSKITKQESRAVAAFITTSLQNFSTKPDLAGPRLVQALGKQRRHFSPALLRGYKKMAAA